jgi:hypothetical protein
MSGAIVSSCFFHFFYVFFGTEINDEHKKTSFFNLCDLIKWTIRFTVVGEYKKRKKPHSRCSMKRWPFNHFGSEEMLTKNVPYCTTSCSCHMDHNSWSSIPPGVNLGETLICGGIFSAILFVLIRVNVFVQSVESYSTVLTLIQHIRKLFIAVLNNCQLFLRISSFF